MPSLGSAALIALGCHMASCHTGRCAWDIATQDEQITKRLDPKEGARRLVNLVKAWRGEIQEIMGAWE